MDDLISRGAALNAIDHERDVLIEEKRLGAEHVVVHHARRIIEELPAVDAAPVVRCRECKYGKLCFDANGQGLIQCTNPYYPASFAETWPFDLDWYCAGGERRDT